MKIPPKMSIAPNSLIKPGDSFRKRYANMIEPTGSPNSVIETKAAGRKPRAQLTVE